MDGLPPEGFDGRSTEGFDGRSTEGFDGRSTEGFDGLWLTDGFDGLWLTDGFLSDGRISGFGLLSDGRISGFGLLSGRLTDADCVPDGRPETEGLAASFLVFEDDLEYEDEDVDLDD